MEPPSKSRGPASSQLKCLKPHRFKWEAKQMTATCLFKSTGSANVSLCLVYFTGSGKKLASPSSFPGQSRQSVTHGWMKVFALWQNGDSQPCFKCPARRVQKERGGRCCVTCSLLRRNVLRQPQRLPSLQGHADPLLIPSLQAKAPRKGPRSPHCTIHQWTQGLCRI